LPVGWLGLLAGRLEEISCLLSAFLAGLAGLLDFIASLAVWMVLPVFWLVGLTLWLSVWA
jgi:hypothetical protein